MKGSRNAEQVGRTGGRFDSLPSKFHLLFPHHQYWGERKKSFSKNLTSPKMALGVDAAPTQPRTQAAAPSWPFRLAASFKARQLRHSPADSLWLTIFSRGGDAVLLQSEQSHGSQG